VNNPTDYIDLTTGRTMTGGIGTISDDSDIDLTAGEIAIVATGMVSIQAVADVLQARFGKDDAWTLLMRATAETCRDIVRDNATPQQRDVIEVALGQKVAP
jgi:hypothetical protein